jgi:tetratricopeptide (TPR) repeat protein
VGFHAPAAWNPFPFATMLRALITLLVLAFLAPGPAFASGAGGNAGQPVTYGALSQSQRIAYIRALIEAGEDETAQRLLSASRFDEGDLGYAAATLQAMLYRRQGRLDEAEALLRRIVSERPGFGRVRLELADLLALRGNRDGAAYHLRILADASEDPGSRRRFEGFIDQLDTARPFTIGGFVSLAPSTNINNGSSSGTIMVAGLPFEIAPGGRAESGLGLRAGVNAAFTHRLGESLTAYAAGSAVLSEYSGSRFDTLTGDFRLGLRRRGLDHMLGVELIADRRLIAWQPTDHGLGGRLYARKALAPRLLLSGELQFVKRRYDFDPSLDTRTFSGKARLDWAYAPARSVHVEIGGEDESMPDRPHNSFTGGHVEIGTLQRLPLAISASFAVKAGMRDYEGVFPFMGEAREDRYVELRATFLKSNLAWQGFTPRLGLSYYVQKSNVALYDYDRLAADVTITKEF